MMELMVEFIIAFIELLEAELAAVRQNIYKLVLAVILAVVACLILLGGFGILIWGIYLALQTILSPVWAALVDAAAAFALGGVLLWYARNKVKK